MILPASSRAEALAAGQPVLAATGSLSGAKETRSELNG